MKNPFQENLKISAKNFHKTNRGERFTNGLVIRHQDDETTMSKLSWWEDVCFILNNYLVHVSWTHPRLAFKDQVNIDAHRKVELLDIGVDDFTLKSKPNYVRAGRSRKKITSYTLTGPLISEDWKQAFDLAYAETFREADYKIGPSMKVEWGPYGRCVELCAPIEVKNEDDLRKIAGLTKRLLKNETTLSLEFPSYAYTRQDSDFEELNNLCE